MTFLIFLNFPDWKWNSLTFPWPGKSFIFQIIFPDCGNPVLSSFLTLDFEITNLACSCIIILTPTCFWLGADFWAFRYFLAASSNNIARVSLTPESSLNFTSREQSVPRRESWNNRTPYGLWHKKTCLPGFQLSKTQTSLLSYIDQPEYWNLGSDARKCVCGISDKVRFKPTCSATETS